MNTDPIADFLTRIRNAASAKHKVVEIPSSNMKREMAKILFEKGYIDNYRVEETANHQGLIKIALKYDATSKKNAITKLERISKPGLRKYCGAADLPRVLNGLGIAIISTSKGLITDKEARKENVGGEVVCYVY
jgi:small subunit ribosomal protein S8